MVTCWCCLILLCLQALAVSHLHWPTLSAAFPQCRPPVHSCVWSKAYTALDLQAPALTSQDKMWYFFNTSEYLTSTHLITLNKTTFFRLYFHYFFPLCKWPIISILVLTVFLDRGKIKLLLNTEVIASINKENTKTKKNFHYFNTQKYIFFFLCCRVSLWPFLLLKATYASE